MAHDYRVTETQIGAMTSDGYRFLFRAPQRCLVESIHLVSGTTQAADESNYMTCTVTNIEDDASGTDVVATYSNNLAGGALTADIPRSMVLSTTAANLELAEGDVLQMYVNVDVAGTSRPNDAEFKAIVTWSPGFGSGI